MARKSDFRFTIKSSGHARTLFSVTELSKKGTTFINLKNNHRLQLLPGLGAPLIPGPEIKSQKYTIHPSRNSPNGINYIHHTILLENGRELQSQHVTKAIKGKKSFAYLFCRRCPDMRRPEFVPDDSGTKDISLGIYDADVFSLMYAVAVSHRDRKFDVALPAHVNMSQYTLESIALIVFWTFLALPSHNSTRTGHNCTIKPQDANAELHPGVMEKECLRQFEETCWNLETELQLYTARERANLIHGQPMLVPTKRYFKDGQHATPEALEVLETLKTRIVTL